MKRGWLALIMVAAALLISGMEYLNLSANTEVCIKMLDEADAAAGNRDFVLAESIAKRLDHRFQEQSRGLDFFLYHEEVKNITKALAALRRYGQMGDDTEFLALSARIKRELISIQNTRIPRLEHIL